MNMDMQKYGTEAERVQAFKALSDGRRLQILDLLKAKGASCCSLVGGNEEGLCACDLEEALGISQSVVSHHMDALCRAGPVVREKRGRWMYYRRNDPALVEGAWLASQGETERAGELLREAMALGEPFKDGRHDGLPPFVALYLGDFPTSRELAVKAIATRRMEGSMSALAGMLPLLAGAEINARKTREAASIAEEERRPSADRTARPGRSTLRAVPFRVRSVSSWSRSAACVPFRPR